jgi:hypothetical protein
VDPETAPAPRAESLRQRLVFALTVFWKSVLGACSLAMMAGAYLIAKGNPDLSGQVVTLAFALAVAMVPVGLFTELLIPEKDKR